MEEQKAIVQTDSARNHLNSYEAQLACELGRAYGDSAVFITKAVSLR
jgi:hypothetical protein